jgi:hypothetical protein
MAILASIQSGNFTNAATWSIVDPISYSTSEAGSTAVTNTFTSSAAFTPGAITIDGIGVRLLQTVATPVGTFSVRLAQAGVAVAGTTVTINASDIPNGTNSICGWIFFKFAAPVVLLAATPYTTQIGCSTTGQVTAYRSATANDWSRFLRTTTTAAPAAADTLIVSGEYIGAGIGNTFTVTMNNTAATNFGSIDISGRGVLTFGTTAATAYQLRLAGIFCVTGQGQLNVGTLGTPMPASSSGLILFINATNVDFGMEIRGNAVVTTYGATKIGRAYLSVDASVAATTITTDVSTNWLSGDVIALASTTTTVAQSEERTLSANAVGTTVSVAALGFAHSGSNPTKGELINLTRNVQIKGTSLTLGTYVNNVAGPSATISFNYTEFQFLGSGTTNKRGVECSTIGVGSYAINGCAFRNFEVTSAIGVLIGASVANLVVNDCVFYRMNTNAVNFSSSALASVSVTNCWAFTNISASNALFAYSSPLPTMSGLVSVSSLSGFGVTISTNDMLLSTISNITCHANGAGGISIVANSQLSSPPSINNLITWRNNTNNIVVNGCNNIMLDTISAFGATTSNINFSGNPSTDIQIKNAVVNSGISPASLDGIRFVISCDKIRVDNSFFGAATTHSSGDINSTITRGFLGANFYNCQFGSTNEVIGLNAASYNSYVASSKHDGVPGAFITYTPLGRTTKDNIIFDTTNLGLSDSTRLTPTSVASKLTSDKTVAVPNGRSLKITVGIRRSVIGDGVAYNGALPQLVVKKNHSIGLLTDTLLATATAASLGAFEFITGTTPVATDNGAFTFCATCDGTAGFVNVDSWIVEII